jgi:MraZ protein
VDSIEHLFIGNALCASDSAGRICLPGFVRSILDRRSDSRTIVIGRHECDPCLVAYDRSFARILARDCQRRRLAEEAADPVAQHARVRRIFGFAEEGDFDRRGRLTLPPMMRRHARIDGLALIVGTGAAFEIWNPALALASGDSGLSELAGFHLHAPLAA